MSVDALLGDPHYPFARFLNDRGEYELSRQFWQTSFEVGLKDKVHRADWRGWMSNPLCDGMPIWSAINRKIWRGISVQQVERSEDPVWFKCWLNQTDIDSADELPYLFVETFVSRSSYQFFLKLINEWTDAEVNVARFSRFADETQIEAMAQFPRAAEL